MHRHPCKSPKQKYNTLMTKNLYFVPALRYPNSEPQLCDLRLSHIFTRCGPIDSFIDIYFYSNVSFTPYSRLSLYVWVIITWVHHNSDIWSCSSNWVDFQSLRHTNSVILLRMSRFQYGYWKATGLYWSAIIIAFLPRPVCIITSVAKFWSCWSF